ncbi:MAG: outer membrane beta-barrel protein [Ginsengibacter sp.]
MEHLDNDMDDLFQRAAENYPLQDGKGDWESVAKRIAVKDDPKEVAVPLKSKKNKKLIIFFLFLFILLSGGLMLHILSKPASTENHAIELTKELDNKSYGAKPNNISGEEKATDEFSGKKEINNKKNVQSPRLNNSGDVTGISNTSFNSNTKSSGEINSKKNTLVKTPGKTNVDFSPGTISQEKPNEEITENLKNNSENVSEQPKKENEVLKEQKTGNDNSVIPKNNVKKNAAEQKKNGFYVGVLTGFDFSKVKSSSFDNAGFDAGLLLGFRLNQSLSFETGVLWNKKNYNSDGKYFNMDKIRSSMPSGMIVKNLESKSSLIEIPIKAKFDFIRKTNADLFVTGGVASYIMTKEKNWYNANVNGTNEKVSGVYEKDNYGFPAVANLSFGYEHNVLKTLNIRIEPFLKIPLQGMGVGNLPVTSAGVQIGITGRLK